jgi:hypothetical protein
VVSRTCPCYTLLSSCSSNVTPRAILLPLWWPLKSPETRWRASALFTHQPAAMQQLWDAQGRGRRGMGECVSDGFGSISPGQARIALARRHSRRQASLLHTGNIPIQILYSHPAPAKAQDPSGDLPVEMRGAPRLVDAPLYASPSDRRLPAKLETALVALCVKQCQVIDV